MQGLLFTSTIPSNLCDEQYNGFWHPKLKLGIVLQFG
jgi:hypothetical protein